MSGSEAAAFAVVSSVIVEMSDEEFEGFMAIVESGPVADERLECLFKRLSPVGRHVELSKWRLSGRALARGGGLSSRL